MAIDHLADSSTIVHAVQLAVAPVFLLTGLAGLLSVLSLRLGRVIDRARLIDRRLSKDRDINEQSKPLAREAKLIWWRIRLLNWAIRLAVSSALFVCIVVISLFYGELATANISEIVAYSFVAAMTLIFLCLIVLLIEVSASTRKMRQELEFMLSDYD